jgi:hypothetical protein
MAYIRWLRIVVLVCALLVVAERKAIAQAPPFNPGYGGQTNSTEQQSVEIGWQQFRNSWTQLDAATWVTHVPAPASNPFTPQLGARSGGYVELKQLHAQYYTQNETAADQYNGIDAKGSVYFYCAAVRTWTAGAGRWTPWQNCGGPVVQVGVRRQNGQWQYWVMSNWQHTSPLNPNQVPGENPLPPAPAPNAGNPCHAWETWDPATGACRQWRAPY